MKKIIVDSLDTTVSNSPPAKAPVRTPIGVVSKIPIHQLMTMPSTPSDKITRKSIQCEQTQLLHLELQQLRRQNRFLKKKIDELYSQLENSRMPLIRGLSERQKQQNYRRYERLPLTINFFFEEIGCMLGQVNNLFKIDPKIYEQNQLNFHQQIDLDKCPSIDISTLNPVDLQKKIEKIRLADETQRFSNFLDLFGVYYSTRTQLDKILTEHVDAMTLKAKDMSKMLLSKYQQKMRAGETDLDDYNPQCDQTPRNQPFTRKHNRNKSGLVEPTMLDSSLKFFRRNKQTAN